MGNEGCWLIKYAFTWWREPQCQIGSLVFGSLGTAALSLLLSCVTDLARQAKWPLLPKGQLMVGQRGECMPRRGI